MIEKGSDMTSETGVRRGVVSPMECVQEGWTLISKDLLLYIGLGLVLLFGSGIVPILLQGPLTCGLFMCLSASARGEKPTFELMFKGFDKFVPSLIVALFQLIAVLVAMIPTFLLMFGAMLTAAATSSQGEAPGPLFFFGILGSYGLMFVLMTAVQALFLFAYPLLAERELDGLAAVKLSIAGVRANLVGVLLLILLNAVISMVALMLCCLPILVAVPLMHASHFAAQRRIFADADVAETFE